MDKNTLKALIIEMKDVDNLSFPQISEKLRVEHNVLKDRQSLHGLYTRAKNKAKQEPKYDIVLKSKVLNLYALGYNMSQVTHILGGGDTDLNYAKVRDIVNNNEATVQEIIEAKAVTAVQMLGVGESVANIKTEIAYNTLTPTDAAMANVMVQAYKMIVRGAITNELTKAMKTTGSRDIVKQLCKELTEEFSYDSVKNQL